MSIVLTDEIRNMHFPKPLKAEEMKYYTEHFALAVLRYCFDCYDSWRAADAPDLQSDDGTAGIEVTELAISLNKAIVGDCLHFWETGDVRYKNKAEHRGARAGEEFYILPSVDSNDELAALETIFRKKLSKLSTYKKRGINTFGSLWSWTVCRLAQLPKTGRMSCGCCSQVPRRNTTRSSSRTAPH